MLEIISLTKNYKTAAGSQTVLQDINLRIQEGEFVMVMGESGSGKSTLLNCISTLDRPTSGQVLFNGENIALYDNSKMEYIRLKKYGFIFQDNHLIDTLTIIENVSLARLQYDKTAYIKARSILDQLGIGELANRYPFQISGGEKQRAAIARALINEPKVLFADEPTASLNPQTAKEIIALLQTLNGFGQTIVMVTHSMRMAAYGTRLLVLVDGNFKIDLDMKHLTIDERLHEIQRMAGQYL